MIKNKSVMGVIKDIEYDPETGVVTHIRRNNSNGSVDTYGYKIIKIHGNQYKAHRLAWAKYYGKDPIGVIDHIDGNKLNNKIKNLRDVSQSENAKCVKKERNKETGVVGIYIDKSTKGLKAIYTTRVNGKAYRYRNLSDAIRFRKEKGLDV